MLRARRCNAQLGVYRLSDRTVISESFALKCIDVLL